MADLGDGARLQMLFVSLPLSPGLKLTGGIPGRVEIVVTGDLSQGGCMPSPISLVQGCPGGERGCWASLAGCVSWKAGGWNASSGGDLNGHGRRS